MQLGDLEPHVDAQRGIEIARAARRTGRPWARARWRGRWRRAGAGRPRGCAGGGRDKSVRLRMRAASCTFASIAGLVHAGHLQRKGDVLVDRHVRIERIGLEHHRQLALGGRRRRSCPRHRAGSCREVVSSSPAISRSRVDLPQPEGPTKTTNSPSFISRLASGMTAWVPKVLLTCSRVIEPICFPYLTAPKVRPRTSCFWLNQPSTRMGAMASVEAALSLAQNSPSGLE